jgi:hypothetical protein
VRQRVDGGEQGICEIIVECREIDDVFAAVADLVDADPDCNQSVDLREMFGEGAVAVFLELGYLVDEGDGEVVVQGVLVQGRVGSVQWDSGSVGWAMWTYYSVGMSAPARLNPRAAFCS